MEPSDLRSQRQLPYVLVLDDNQHSTRNCEKAVTCRLRGTLNLEGYRLLEENGSEPCPIHFVLCSLSGVSFPK